MQAVDEAVSKKITVTPGSLPEGQDKTGFQPTSDKGVSFGEDQPKPTITITFTRGATVRSITIPRKKITRANVKQFVATFFGFDNKPINDKPIESTASPNDDKDKPATVDSSKTAAAYTPVFRIELTITDTTDGRSPKGVVLDIKACVEDTSGKYWLSGSMSTYR